MEMINSSEETREIPSIVNDPFKKISVTSISAHYSLNPYRGTWYAWGTVDFKDGNTSGTQRFDCDTMDNLMIQIHEFLKTLK